MHSGVQRSGDLGPGVKGGITLKILHKISMDLDRYSVPGFDAVCGDRYTWELEIALYAGGAAWEIPAGTSVTVRYQKPDGSAGVYDLLPDGTAAWGIRGNVVTVMAAPQTMTVPGCVILTVRLTAGGREISTFQIIMNVRPAVGLVESESGDYWYLSGSLPQPKNAAVGEVLVVDSVDSMGRVTGLRTAGAAGLSAKQISALEDLFEIAAYIEDPTAFRQAFRAAFGLEHTEVPATGITLSAAALTFTDTAARQLTAALIPADTTDPLIWSTSDPAVARVSGGLVTPVGNGTCVITASAGIVSASCQVRVAFPEEVKTYSITYHLTNAICSETAAVIEAGDSFTADIIANAGYTLDTVTVTMGGVDISSDAVAYDFIAIGSVTGDVVITANAVKNEEEVNTYTVTNILTNVTSSNAAASVEAGSSYSATLKAAGGYLLDAVIVIMGSKDITATAYADGVITIAAVTGDVIITATAVESAQWFSVEYAEKDGYYKAGVLTSWNNVYNTGLVAVGDATQIFFKATYDGHHYCAFFDSAMAYISQHNPWGSGEYTWDIPEGAMYFSIAYYGDERDTMILRVNAENVRHRVTANLTNASISSAVTNVVENTAYNAALSASSGRTLSGVTVTMGGADITASAYADGVITIAAATGDIVITAEGVV